MNHLINSYGLFLAFFFFMFIFVAVIDYLIKKFNIGFLSTENTSGQQCPLYKEYLSGSDCFDHDSKTIKRLEKRIEELEAEVKVRSNVSTHRS